MPQCEKLKWGSKLEEQDYQCYAPASLYKYYSDSQLHLNSIRNNKMWYSAPCNFNDVFDCNIAIDEQKVFYEALKLFPDKRGIRPVVKYGKIFGQQ